MSKYDKHQLMQPDAGVTGRNIAQESDEMKKQMKKELADVFRKYGYLDEKSDHEVKIKITSGNIAWININSIETIK